MKKILFTAILFSLISYSCDDEDSVDQPSGNGTLSEKIVLINIEGGTFTMGGVTIQGDAPKVTVSLTEFQISEKEITNEQYVEFLNNAYLDGWIKVSFQSINDPCGSYSENMVIGEADSPYPGEIFLQLAESGGCTSGGETAHINNKSWISFDSSSNTFELLDTSKEIKKI